MAEYPKSLVEFENWFSSEEACRQYLFGLRWPQGFRCPRCQHDRAWKTRRGLYSCSDSKCNFQVSVTTGTIFHGSRKPLQLWFRAIWHITSQYYGANALELQRILGFGSYHTAWEWLHKLRHAMVISVQYPLFGYVEVDKIHVSGQRIMRDGRVYTKKALVVIAVKKRNYDRHIKTFRIGRVTDASEISLTKFIKKNIRTGSIVCTDSWDGYQNLKHKGYRHIVSSESAMDGNNLLPLAHKVSSSFKKWLQGTYKGSVRTSHLDYYIDEYTFRFNNRQYFSEGWLFHRLLKQAVATDPLYGKNI